MTAPGVRWSFVTVTYNSSRDLAEFWGDRRPGEVEWIVVDNASADDSADVAQALGATVYRLGTNVGFAKANNIGFSRAVGRYIAFANPDVRPNYGTLELLEGAIDQTRGLVAPQLLNPDGTYQPNGRGMPTLLAKLNNRLRFSQSLSQSYVRIAKEGQLVPVSWCMGAAVAGRADDFNKLGGPWDESFFVYYEDSELGLSAWREGMPVVVSGDAQWTHGWARETMGFNKTAWKLEVRSALAFYRKHPYLLVRRSARSLDPAFNSGPPAALKI